MNYLCLKNLYVFLIIVVNTFPLNGLNNRKMIGNSIANFARSLIKHNYLSSKNNEITKESSLQTLIENIKLNINKDDSNKDHSNENTFMIYPPKKLSSYNTGGILSWYPIGFDRNFAKNKPNQITLNNVNYIIWKDQNNNYYALRDSCSHQGSSFKYGKTHSNVITCPYHGYIFNGNNGSLINIPKMKFTPCKEQTIDTFKVIKKADVVYLNTIPLLNLPNETFDNLIIEDKTFFEAFEYNDPDFKVLYLEKDFEHSAKIVTLNSLDISHIAFVHSFGNKERPNPCNNFTILPMDTYYNTNITINNYGTVYKYYSGKNSLVNRLYKMNELIVQNIYILPHTTIARVLFGKWASTIVTHALPISKFKTRLFIKVYRNYLYYDLKKMNIFDFMYPFKYLINIFGDYITVNTMKRTVNEDKRIIDNIDKYNYESMHGKFSIINDLLSDHYKENYKKYYE